MENPSGPQLLQDMRLPPSFFARSRENLKNCLGDRYLVLLAAGRAPYRTSDANYPFFASRNFFYNTGIEQESSILLLYRDGEQQRDILFIPARNAMTERWSGHAISLEEAAARSGLAEIEYLPAYEGVLADLLAKQPVRLWMDYCEKNSQTTEIQNWLGNHCPGSEIANLTTFLTQLRMIKRPEEVAMIREAINLTGRGIDAMSDMLRPGLMEYQLWSVFQNTLAMEGCLEPAFVSIVASGENTFCLHYMNPRSKILDGDLVQVDVGAFVGGFCGDISRVFPANGRFSPRQLAIYQAVRNCQETAFAAIKPGMRIGEINDLCKETARNDLTRLGIMGGEDSVTEYFWHNVSHHLGMDVHDLANRDALLQSGMVLTVEPGIYVQKWEVGLRIEDDVLVTDDGCVILSQAIPREAAEIEAALQNLSGLL